MLQSLRQATRLLVGAPAASSLGRMFSTQAGVLSLVPNTFSLGSLLGLQQQPAASLQQHGAAGAAALPFSLLPPAAQAALSLQQQQQPALLPELANLIGGLEGELCCGRDD